MSTRLEGLSSELFDTVAVSAAMNVLGGLAVASKATFAGWDIIDGQLYAAYISDPDEAAAATFAGA